MGGKIYFKDGRTIDIKAGKCYGNFYYYNFTTIHHGVVELFNLGGDYRFYECNWIMGRHESPIDHDYLHLEYEDDNDGPIFQLERLVLPEDISSLKIWYGYEIEEPLVIPVGVKYVLVPNHVKIANLDELYDNGVTVHFITDNEVTLDNGTQVFEYYTHGHALEELGE